jgi:hypothetical protein
LKSPGLCIPAEARACGAVGWTAARTRNREEGRSAGRVVVGAEYGGQASVSLFDVPLTALLQTKNKEEGVCNQITLVLVQTLVPAVFLFSFVVVVFLVCGRGLVAGLCFSSIRLQPLRCFFLF